VRLGLCLPVLALLGLVGCEDHHRGDGRYGGYYNRPYAYPYGGYDRGWWGRDWDDRRRYDRDRGNRGRYARDEWKERRYERKQDNSRPGDAERFNNRLCNNGIRGDAPAGCRDN
jgi:hypothetical protein